MNSATTAMPIRVISTPSDEELRAIKKYVILPLVMTAFERDSRAVAAAVKTPGPYIDAIQRSMDALAADLGAIRRKFRKTNVRVHDSVRTADGLKTEYIVRGYTGSIVMNSDVLRVEAEMFMRTYLNRGDRVVGTVGDVGGRIH